MTLPRCAASALFLALLAGSSPAEEPSTPNGRPPEVFSHEITVSLEPETGGIELMDLMSVRRNGGGDLRLDCRAGLVPRAFEVDGKAPGDLPREETAPKPGFVRYRVRVPRGPGEIGTVLLGLGGKIREEVEKARDLAFVAGDRSAGTISPAGVFLSDATGWTPSDGGLATYAVTASLPEGWTAASQGGVPTEKVDGGRAVVSFPAGLPTDGLWLQAGKWKVERRATAKGVSVATYLSEANASHSKLILDSVEEYLGLYGKVLGPYPHAKFDVVENFFSTGYGMPSATLLGGDVIAHMAMMAQRSGGKVPAGYLDHELVHGWWGNGVLVDYASGNWCEALTTYCANYLRKEWDSAEEGAKHRRGVRARFAARVEASKDYPVRKFTGKTEDLDNDIGYGKGSMVFHSVRRSVGDQAFFDALRDVATGFAGRRASWDDLRAAFEKRSGRNLAALFDQALDRTGAPVLALEGCTVAPAGDGWQVAGRVVQRSTPWWRLSLPLVVETVRGAESTTLDLTGESTDFSLRTTSLPVRVLLDPDSHAWRGCARGEKPAMLDGTIHDPVGFEVWVPAGEAGAPFQPVLDAVAARAASVVRFGGNVFDPAPAPAGTRSILALGNLATDLGLRALLDEVRVPIRIEGNVLRVDGQKFEGDDVALLVSDRHPGSRERTFTVYAGMSPAALAAARRVFFYGGDGIVVFKAGRPVLRLEAEGEESTRAPLLEGLLPEAQGPRAMRLVEALCTKELDGRLAGSEAGAAAVELLAKTLAEDGLKVVRQDSSFDAVEWDGSDCDARGMLVPFFFSVPRPDWVDAGDTVVHNLPATPEALITLVRTVVEEGKAPGIFLIGEKSPPDWVKDYLAVAPPAPSSDGSAAAPKPDPAIAVAGKRSRLLLPDFPIGIHVFYVPSGWGQGAGEKTMVRAALRTRRIPTTNLFAVIPGSDPALAGEGILLGAHHDHLGPGFPGANDNATGMAAVREAGRILATMKGALRRPVVLAFFGAEEWGLQGSRRFAASPPEGLPRIVAALTLDTVGQRGVPSVNVVGESIYPPLGAAMGRCLAGAGLRRGRDIDRFAFAWGSDHYALHAAGIPAIDLFSAEYRTMHTSGDTTDTVEPDKLVRMARAAAAFVLSLSREGPPR